MDRSSQSRHRWPSRSVGRIAAMVVAIVVHLGVLALLLRPGAYEDRAASRAEPNVSALELRLIPSTRPERAVTVNKLARTANTAPRPTSRPLHADPISATRENRETPLSERAGATQPTSDHPETTPAQPQTPGNSIESAHGSDQPTTFGDGGFGQQLRHAQSAGSAHGVPGSDRHIAPGIQLIDPLNQGVGSVMRNTQRLFGVPNRHCIDVEVARSLTPEQRIERHISMRDLDIINETYRCNSPLGLPL